MRNHIIETHLLEKPAMKLLVVSAAISILGILPTQAQNVNWTLIDSGVLIHPDQGTGIEMRIKPDHMPNDLLKSDKLDDIMASLCSHFAPSVIPFIQETMDVDEPNFISVRIKTGGTFGRYFLTAYSISDGTCGDPL